MIKYEEKLSFHPMINLVFIVLVGTLAWTVWQEPGPPLLLIMVGMVLMVIPLIFSRLVIRVDERELYVAFGLFGWPVQRIPLDAIVKIRAIEYKPLLQFGGWGIRRGRYEGESTSAYTIRGKRGILLELTKDYRIATVKTRRFLVSSANPDRLTAAIGR